VNGDKPTLVEFRFTKTVIGRDLSPVTRDQKFQELKVPETVEGPTIKPQ